MEEPKLLVGHVASGDTIFTADVLQQGAELWLVVQWLQTQDGRWKTPGRAIRVDLLPHQMSGAFGADLTLGDSIPKAVLDWETSNAEGMQFEVLEGPADRFGWLAARTVS